MDSQVFKYCFEHDDGKIMEDLESSDVILLGPSRVGKTPLCFYLGYFGIKATNIPLVPEINLTETLRKISGKKVFGLIRSVESIQRIRKTREEYLGLESNYSKQERIFEELEYAIEIYNTLRCPIIDMDKMGIEECQLFISKRINN